jgi:hypothetical protein
LIKNDLYELLFDKNKSFEEIYHFLNSNFTVENVQELFDVLGKPLIEHCIEFKKTNSENLFKIAYIITDYQKMIDSNLDPLILNLNVLGKLKELFS